ncbi:MAG: 4-alpha-glucanotransferase [Pyrinomonadaceae bacterium]
MNFPRASGILLHISSLPSALGIGDLGPKAFEFVDLLLKAKQKYWQILPLGQTGYGNSPYQCYSAYAGNIYLISLEKLVDEGFLASHDLGDAPQDTADRVDFDSAVGFKLPLLKKAFENFRQTSNEKIIADFHSFCNTNGHWLEDYALFQALRSANDDAPWLEWDEPLKLRKPEALEKAKHELDDEIFAQKFYQFAFFRQWFALKSCANRKGILIIGDIPIYVAFDSSDVWCSQDQFKLNEDGTPAVVAGVPPDYFSKTGQLWGNPIYNWEKMRAEGFGWWIGRLRFNLSLFDIARLDHFIGFTRAWEVPGKDKTAEHGQWVSVPGHDLFSTFRHALGDLPLLAEDLGDLTPEVENLRDSFGLPGMRILQFAFGGDARNSHLPHNCVQNALVYTGTHDNDTVVGWFKSKKKVKKGADTSLEHCSKYMRIDPKEIHWEFIRTALASVADIAIIPMQDLLGLDNKARMNVPATTDGNWSWRYTDGDLTDAIAVRLTELNELYGR